MKAAANYNWNGYNLLCWLGGEISHLEKTERNEYGDGKLSAFKRVVLAIDEGRSTHSTPED